MTNSVPTRRSSDRDVNDVVAVVGPGSRPQERGQVGPRHPQVAEVSGDAGRCIQVERTADLQTIGGKRPAGHHNSGRGACAAVSSAVDAATWAVSDAATE